MIRSFVRWQAIGLCVSLAFALAAKAEEPNMEEVVRRGFEFLAKAQNEKGQISPRLGSGVTALAITAALLANGQHAKRPPLDPLSPAAAFSVRLS